MSQPCRRIPNENVYCIEIKKKKREFFNNRDRYILHEQVSNFRNIFYF